jgi:hypothetical protein
VSALVLALIPVLPASPGTGATTGLASPAGHRNHAGRESRMETRRVGNRGASRALPGLEAPSFPLFFHPFRDRHHPARGRL